MSMEHLVILLAVLWIATKVAQAWHKAEAKVLEDYAKQAEKDSTLMLSVEKIGDIIYCWDAGNNDFICQGRTAQELRENFHARFPDRNAAILHGDDALVQSLESEITEMKEQEKQSEQS